jgi:hypothetical protein
LKTSPFWIVVGTYNPSVIEGLTLEAQPVRVILAQRHHNIQKILPDIYS